VRGESYVRGERYVRSNAKASSAGSSTHRAHGLGRAIRGADATRALSHNDDGSGAPSRRGRIVALSLSAALLALALLASSAFASKEVISDFGTVAESGSFGGELNNPRDVAVNEAGAGPANAGDVYVADEANNRIERFDSNGNFISAWGKDTIAAAVNERQRFVIEATGGTYTLSFDGSTTAPIPNSAGSSDLWFTYLAPLPTVGGYENVEASGRGTPANPFVITFKGALGGADQPTLTADTSQLSGTVEISTIVNGTSSVARSLQRARPAPPRAKTVPSTIPSRSRSTRTPATSTSQTAATVASTSSTAKATSSAPSASTSPNRVRATPARAMRFATKPRAMSARRAKPDWE